MARMQGTAVQLRRHRDEHLRYAQRDAKALQGARAQFRAHYLTMLKCEWDAAFWADTNPDRSKGIGANVPRLQRYMTSDAAIIARLEAEVVDSLATARKAAAALAKLEAQYDRWTWQEPGWWTLVRLCWQGWRKQRALA